MPPKARHVEGKEKNPDTGPFLLLLPFSWLVSISDHDSQSPVDKALAESSGLIT